MKFKTAAIISPYFHILGGGEKYLLDLTKLLSLQYQIDFFVADSASDIRQQAVKKFGIDLPKAFFLDKKIFFKSNFIQKLILTRKYDLLFYMTDGSLFASLAKKNILIVQSLAHIPKNNSFLTRFKLKFWQRIICYSQYVKNDIEKRLTRKIDIIAPAINSEVFKPGKKENIILSVGRFFPYLHSKKQAVLVDAFANIIKRKLLSGWQLILVGSVDKGADKYFSKIKLRTKALPITIYSDLGFEKLKVLYQKAKIYWHAAGFGEDLTIHPERAEHFGITTLEAMSAGCVPIVFAAGGQLELVKHTENGFLWREKKELIDYTLKLFQNEKIYEKMSVEASITAAGYSFTNFKAKWCKLICSDEKNCC